MDAIEILNKVIDFLQKEGEAKDAEIARLTAENAEIFKEITSAAPPYYHKFLEGQKEIARLKELLGKAERLRNVLLSTVQRAYRKHHLDDYAIGWIELSEEMCNTLCEAMTDAGFREWLKNVSSHKQIEEFFPDKTAADGARCIAPDADQERGK